LIKCARGLVWRRVTTDGWLAQAGGPNVEATLGQVRPTNGTTHNGDDPDRTGDYSVGAATSDGQRFPNRRPHTKAGLGAEFVAIDSKLFRPAHFRNVIR
jgi:hypothetical protein